MAELEVVSAYYKDILAVVQAAEGGGPARKEQDVDQEFIDAFKETQLLNNSEFRYPAVHLFFMKQAIVTVQHDRRVEPVGSYHDIFGDAREVMLGKRHIVSSSYVAVNTTPTDTEFMPLEEIKASGRVTPYTRQHISQLVMGGRFGDPVTLELMPLIDPSVKTKEEILALIQPADPEL